MAVAAELGLESAQQFIAEILGLDGTISKRGELRILCPIHEQDATQHKPSCDINVYTGLWRCWSCGRAGDLVKLTRLVLGTDTQAQALAMLRPDNPDSARVALKSRLRGSLTALDGPGAMKSHWKPVVPSWGSWEAPRADLWAQRGITEETLERWGIRWVHRQKLEREDDRPFAITKCHAIPITNEHGVVQTWCFRSTEESEKWQPRYLYTPGIDTERLLFGRLHHHAGSTQVVGLTEGAIDAMYLDQCGFPALATLGSTSAGEANLNYLGNFRTLVLVCDRNLAGVLMAEKLGQALVSRGVGVLVCQWRPWMRGRTGASATDANDLPPLDLELIWETSIPWSQWRLRRQH